MDPTSTTSPILRIQPLTSYQSGGQQQRAPFPFAQGQLLQGSISAKNGANQFTIDIGGRQVLAESTAQLQVGQKLNLQVTTLTPQVELQIVSSNTVNRMIGNSIHLIGQQAAIFPNLTDLAAKSDLLPQLSTNSKETLQVYADSMSANRSSVASTPALQTQVAVQLFSKTIEAFSTPQVPNVVPTYEEIGNLLQQLAQNSSLSPAIAAQAAQLADLFSQSAAMQSPAEMPLQTETMPPPLLTAEDTALLLNQIGTRALDNSQIQNLISRLLPLLQENAALPSTQPFQQLVAFLARLPSTHVETQSFQMDGKQLQQFIDRLGVHMEHLLANGNREEAAQTLKFALLELAQQLPAGDKNAPQAVQIAKSIELYQLLQIRLANDSLAFVPLPLSFLNQGYLLIDADQSNHEAEGRSGQSDKNSQLFELHLQLEGLGNLQIDIRQKDGGVALKFLTEDTQRAKFLATHRDELSQWLTSAHLESAQFLVGAKEPVKSLLEKIMSGATGMVDTKA